MISREDVEKLNKEDCVRFSIKTANLVSHLNDDPRVIDAIEAAEDWLADPSEKNRQAAYIACIAASNAAADAWDADSATWDAAAAWAAEAAWAAARAVARAAAKDAYAADVAVWTAAWTAIKADPSVETVLSKYLEELLSGRDGDD